MKHMIITLFAFSLIGLIGCGSSGSGNSRGGASVAQLPNSDNSNNGGNPGSSNEVSGDMVDSVAGYMALYGGGSLTDLQDNKSDIGGHYVAQFEARENFELPILRDARYRPWMQILSPTSNQQEREQVLTNAFTENRINYMVEETENPAITGEYIAVIKGSTLDGATFEMKSNRRYLNHNRTEYLAVNTITIGGSDHFLATVGSSEVYPTNLPQGELTYEGITYFRESETTVPNDMGRGEFDLTVNFQDSTSHFMASIVDSSGTTIANINEMDIVSTSSPFGLQIIRLNSSINIVPTGGNQTPIPAYLTGQFVNSKGEGVHGLIYDVDDADNPQEFGERYQVGFYGNR